MAGVQWLDYRSGRRMMDQGDYYPLYFLTGEESYLIHDLLSRLQARFLADQAKDLDYVQLDFAGKLDREKLEQLQRAVTTVPFLSDRKLVCLNESGFFNIPAGESKLKQDLLDFIKTLPDEACLVVIDSKLDKRNKSLLAALTSKGICLEIKKETGAALVSWLRRIAEEREKTISRPAAESLISRCDGLMTPLQKELKKVLLYMAESGDREISPQLLDFVCGPDLQGTVFQMTDQLAAGRIEEALKLLDSLTQQGEAVPLLQFMLSRHIKQLICARELKSPSLIQEKLKLMGFVAQKLAKQAKFWQEEKLEKVYRSCYETDLLVKQGRLDDRQGLELLLIRAGLMR